MSLKNLNLIKYDFIVSIIFLSLLIKIENVLTWTILALLSLTTLVLLDRKKKIKGINENNKFILKKSFLFILIPLFFIRNDPYHLLIFSSLIIYSGVALGLMFQMGLSGITNFAVSAIFGVGAYFYGLISPYYTGVFMIFLSGLTGTIFGLMLIIPTIRTSGHYTALVTIAVAVLFKVFLEVSDSFGGPQGIKVHELTLFGKNVSTLLEGIGFSIYSGYVILSGILLLAAFFIVLLIQKSWVGNILDTLRNDEILLASMGISPMLWKIYAFSIGNFIIATFGGLYASLLGHIAPANFSFAESLIFFSIIIIGGMGNIFSIFVGTIIIVLLPEKIQNLQEYRFLLFALLVIIILVIKPNGIFPQIRRKTFD